MEFATVMRGYDKEQVDNVLDDFQAKVQHLESENADLKRKLETSKKLIRRFTDMENDLRQDIAESKKAAAAMVSDTQESSEKFLNAVREECGKVISELDTEIEERMAIIDNMKAEVAAFKEQLFDVYSAHIDAIEKYSAEAENFAYVPDYSNISNAVEEFENAASTEIEIPVFPEYPQESIFAEVIEDENAKGMFAISEEQSVPESAFEIVKDEPEAPVSEEDNLDFVMEETAEPSADFEIPEDMEQVDDTLGYEVSEEPEFAFDIEEEIYTEETPEAYEPEETIIPEYHNILSDAEEIAEDIEAYEDETTSQPNEDEYFSFLKNFINEEEKDGE